MATMFFVFLFGVSMFINVTVGFLAYLAIRESQRCRHECERITEQLNYIRQQTPFSPVFRAAKPSATEYFATIMNAALINYERAAA